MSVVVSKLLRCTRWFYEIVNFSVSELSQTPYSMIFFFFKKNFLTDSSSNFWENSSLNCLCQGLVCDKNLDWRTDPDYVYTF